MGQDFGSVSSKENNVSKYLAYALMLAVSVVGSAARADDLAGGYPKHFGQTGVITEINYTTRTVTMKDLSLTLGPRVVVHTTASTQSENLFMLQPGQRIGCIMEQTPTGRSVVTDVWILPGAGPLLPPPGQ